MNFQSVSSNLVSPEWNELASLKFAIRRALSTLSIGYRGNYRNVRIFSVDLPLSPKAFCSLFAPEYGAESSFKKTFTVAEMKCVFGHDWDCFQFKNSSTRKRVFRNVYLHFRKKTIQGKSSTNLIRYNYYFPSAMYLQQGNVFTGVCTYLNRAIVVSHNKISRPPLVQYIMRNVPPHTHNGHLHRQLQTG